MKDEFYLDERLWNILGFVEIYKISNEKQDYQNTIIVSNANDLANELDKLSEVIFDSLPYEKHTVESGVLLYILTESYEVLDHFPYHITDVKSAMKILEKYKFY